MWVINTFFGDKNSNYIGTEDHLNGLFEKTHYILGKCKTKTVLKRTGYLNRNF